MVKTRIHVPDKRRRVILGKYKFLLLTRFLSITQEDSRKKHKNEEKKEWMANHV